MKRSWIFPLESAFSVFAWIAISLSTTLWFLLIGLAFLVHPLLDPERRVLHRLASWWGRTLVALAPGVHLEIRGLEHVPKSRPVIFMANHQSYVDVPALFSLPFQFRWVADEDLFRIPVFGWAMGLAGYIPVRRGQARSGVEALARAKGYLEKGISIFLFPEGTRSHTGVLGSFQTGGFRIAFQTHAPVVPVVVLGTRQLLPRGSWVFRWRIRVKIHVLPPILPPQDRRQLRSFMDKVRQQMGAHYRDLLTAYSQAASWYDKVKYGT